MSLGRGVLAVLRRVILVPFWVPLALLACALAWARLTDQRPSVSVVVVLLAGAWLVAWFNLRGPRITDWQAAERASATWLRRVGCRRVSLTARGRDGGVDVLTSDLAVQVKHTERPVGRPAVQQIVGAALSVERKPAIVSTSGFTAPAHEYADVHDVALLHLGTDGEVRRTNRSATRVGRRGHR